MLIVCRHQASIWRQAVVVARMLETGVRALIMGLGGAGIDAVERLLGYRMPGRIDGVASWIPCLPAGTVRAHSRSGYSAPLAEHIQQDEKRYLQPPAWLPRNELRHPARARTGRPDHHHAAVSRRWIAA